MLKRRKRIPYDPPGQRKKGKRPTWRRSDQIFLTRRMLLMKGTIVAGFAALIGRLGYMQILQGSQYSAATKEYTEKWIRTKATRGLIFDRQGRALAENRRVWEVRVVPSELPKKDTPEYEGVRNRLITALRLPEMLVVDPEGVPVGSEDTVYRRLARLMGYTDQATEPPVPLIDRLPKRLGPTPKTKMEQFVESIKHEATYNYYVAIDQFDPDEAARIRSVAQELPGVLVMNQFDFLVANTAVRDAPIVLKSDVSREIALLLEANRIKLPGVHLDDSALVRAYPGGESMSHILGYVGKINPDELKAPENQTPGGNAIYDADDIIGKNGIELTMEALLRGSKGGRYIQVDGMGFEREAIHENPPVPGRNLKMTIDLELQSLATQALADGLRFSNEDRGDAGLGDFDAGSGAVVVLDPRNGEVHALVSYPTYDNQLFVDGISYRKFEEYDKNPHKPLTNHAYANQFPPGSTIKVFTALAGLRDKVITADTTFTCTGGIYVPFTWDITQGVKYLCWQHAGHGTLDLASAIEQSCDVYFFNVGTPKKQLDGADEYLSYRDYRFDSGTQGERHYFQGLGIDKIHDYLFKRFWFGRRTGIELPFEAAGIVPDPAYKQEIFNDGWSAGDTINTSIGQGFLEASPLQMALNTAAIANGGTIYEPRLLHEIVDDTQQPLQAMDTKRKRRIKIVADHLHVVRQGMWRVCNSETGTAHHSTIRGTDERVSKWLLTNPDGEAPIVIAGKTGTAEVGAKKDDGTYTDSHAWFTCYAPFDEPEVVVTVFLNKGGEGSSYAVPIADRVLRAYFELAGKRKRGLVLREDKEPIGKRIPAPDPSEFQVDAATPEAGADASDGTDVVAGDSGG
ncbi:MAG TPA: penicillin-binding protein 2 [Thermomicrobiales bacterium]|nr:penicillin-binding protein 2 [Thermomicrobiales bacterium]